MSEQFDTEVCAECLDVVPRSEMMIFPGFSVCGACKRGVIRKLHQGRPIGRVWCDRKRRAVLVIGRDFPSRCVRCNGPARRKTIPRVVCQYWPWRFLLLPAIPLFFLSHFFPRKTHVFGIPL